MTLYLKTIIYIQKIRISSSQQFSSKKWVKNDSPEIHHALT